jgi:hypothetical protein
MVLVSPSSHVDAVLKEVIVNGPAAATVVTVRFISELQPAKPVKSLAIPRNDILLPTEGTTSQVLAVEPLNIVERFGKYLVGLVLGSILLKTGPEVFVAAGGIVWAVPVKSFI